MKKKCTGRDDTSSSSAAALRDGEPLTPVRNCGCHGKSSSCGSSSRRRSIVLPEVTTARKIKNQCQVAEELPKNSWGENEKMPKKTNGFSFFLRGKRGEKGPRRRARTLKGTGVLRLSFQLLTEFCKRAVGPSLGAIVGKVSN